LSGVGSQAPSGRLGSLSSLALRIAVLGGQTAVTLWIAWIAAPEAFGGFAAAIGWAGLGAAAASGGSTQTALRIPRLMRPGSPRRSVVIALLVQRSHRLGLAFGALLVPLTAWTLGLPWMTAALTGGLTWALSIHGVLQGSMIASGKLREFLFAEGLLRLPVQFVAILTFQRWTAELSSTALLAAAGAALLPLPALMIVRGEFDPAATLAASVRRLRRRLNRFAWSTTVNALLYSGLSTSDLLVASLVVGPSNLAGFALATRASGLLGLLQGTVFEARAHRYAVAIQARDRPGTDRISRTVVWESSALTICVLGAIISARWLPESLLPPVYRDALTPAAILVVGRAIAALFGPVAALLTLTGRHRRLAAITAASIGVQGALMVAFGSRWGAVGLSVGAAVAMAAFSAMLRISSRHGAVRNSDTL
jgi:O-antigen/teichoic acid export membrane protein